MPAKKTDKIVETRIWLSVAKIFDKAVEGFRQGRELGVHSI
jgi:hypothetical protein